MTTDHKTLGVSVDATKEEITSAYRRLAMKYHPDRNTSIGAGDKFIEVKAAYERIIAAGFEKKQQKASSSKYYGTQHEYDFMEEWRKNAIIEIEKATVSRIVTHLLSMYSFYDEEKIITEAYYILETENKYIRGKALIRECYEKYMLYANNKRLRSLVSKFSRLPGVLKAFSYCILGIWGYHVYSFVSTMVK